MHDIDRVLFEMEQMEVPTSYELAGEQQESLEAEMAGQLLEVSSEQELDRFLGSLLSRATSALGLGNLDAGRALGGLLKSTARRVLPRLGQTLGGYLSPSGGQIGSRLGSFVGSQLGLELEGLSQEDREYEVSRAFVRFANQAAQQAIASPPTVPPVQAALGAATSAAQQQLPGLLPLIQQLTPPRPPIAGARQNGQGEFEAGYGQGESEAGYGQGESEAGYGQGEFEAGYGQGESEAGYGQGEFEAGYGQGESEAGYGQGEFEAGYGQGESDAGYGEAELAQELMGISSEAELDQFLGGLVRGAFGSVGKLLRSDVGRALTGVLKGVARRALPSVGSALGTFVAPGIGTAVGGQLGTFASNLFEAGEAEMLAEDEAEMEAALRYVRFARGTARQAALAPSRIPGPVVARAAAIAAARRYAPALLRTSASQQQPRWRDRRRARYGYYRPSPAYRRPRRYPPWYDAWPAPSPWAWPPGPQQPPPGGNLMPTSGPMGNGAQGDGGGAPTDGGGSPGSAEPGDTGDPFAGAGYGDAGEFGMY